MIIRSVKLKILQRWSFSSKHVVLSQYSNNPIWASFFKISISSLFLAYNLMSRAVTIFLYRSLKKVPTGILNFLHLFLSWNFFSKDLLKRFLWTLKHVGVYEKNLDRTTHQSDYMPEKVKELRFWKNETQHWDGIFWQNLMFWAETFFKRGKISSFRLLMVISRNWPFY